jgi:hypothetical protein
MLVERRKTSERARIRPEWLYPLRAKRFEPVTIVIALVSAVIAASVATIFAAVELDKMRAKQQKADTVAKLGLMASKEISNSQVELIRLMAEVTNALDAAWGIIDTINHVLLVCDVADKQVGVMESAMQAAMGGDAGDPRGQHQDLGRLVFSAVDAVLESALRWQRRGGRVLCLGFIASCQA